MKPHESPRIRKKSIRGDSGDSWPVWNRGINESKLAMKYDICHPTMTLMGLLIYILKKPVLLCCGSNSNTFLC